MNDPENHADNPESDALDPRPEQGTDPRPAYEPPRYEQLSSEPGGWPPPAGAQVPEPTSAQAPEPTTTYETLPPYPTAFGQPPVIPPAAPEYGGAEYGGTGSGSTGRPGLPGWTWPLISVLALVLGVVGGLIGGSLVGDDSDSGASGGVLKVERRTAPPLNPDNSSVAKVAAEVLPSTVQIVAEYNGRDQGATGSGFVFDKQGHVITNNHVIAEAAADEGPIDVIDHEGRHHRATVVGRSAVYDLAVLKVPGIEDLEPIAQGSANQMRVGETVVAFGSPLGLTATVTSGIISAVNRPVTTGDGDESSYINAVQTDAAINPGNSGGPLVNLQGQLIGVNSAIATTGSQSASDEGGNIGVGFAIPIEQVLVTADQILRTGKALYPVIGANVRGTRGLDGATVESILSGGPASKSDLKVGDVITRVDDQPVSGSSDVVVAVRSHVPGETVTLTVKRGGKTLEIKVKLESKVG